jgi:hypothetical protein
MLKPMDSFGDVILRGVSAVWPKERRTARRHNDRDKILSFIGERGSLGDECLYIRDEWQGSKVWREVIFLKRYWVGAMGDEIW